jgi:GNAT superfamily N-acetyltransferase
MPENSCQSAVKISMHPTRTNIRQANAEDSAVIAEILGEAARWLAQSGKLMWRADELKPEHIAADVAAGLFFLVEISGQAVGTVKFQLEDSLFWPDQPQYDAAYDHRLTVRRAYASQGVSTALLQWAVDRARALGKRWLRLDCEASRPRLRAVYERFGFRHHSDRQVGPYYVSRCEFDLAK